MNNNSSLKNNNPVLKNNSQSTHQSTQKYGLLSLRIFWSQQAYLPTHHPRRKAGGKGACRTTTMSQEGIKTS